MKTCLLFYLLFSLTIFDNHAFVGFGTSKQGYIADITKEFWAVIELANGQILVIGDSGADAVIAGYTNEGKANTAFGTSTNSTTLGVGADDDFFDAVELPNGKLVVVGDVGTDAVIAQYTAAGSLDTGNFNTGDTAGYEVLNISDDDKFWKVHRLSSGKFLVAGSTDESGGNGLIAQFTAAGVLDTGNFTANGYVTDSNSSSFRGMTVLSSGKIVVAGDDGTDGVIAQYTAAAALDSSNFGGGDGYATLSAATEFNVIQVTPDGKYIVAGTDDTNAIIAQFTAAGVLDTAGFGAPNGYITFTSAQRFWHALVTSSGKIVAIGHTSGTDGIVARFNADGSVDNTFGNENVNYVTLTDSSIFRGGTISRDGKIIVCGNDGTNGFLASYFANGKLDTASNWTVKTFQEHARDSGKAAGILSINQ